MRTEAEIVRRDYERRTAKDIAAELGRSSLAVHHMAQRLGLRKRGEAYWASQRSSTTPRPRPWAAAELSILRREYGKVDCRELADALGRSGESVYTMAKKLKLDGRGRRRRFAGGDKPLRSDSGFADKCVVRGIRPLHAQGGWGTPEWFASCDAAFHEAMQAAYGGRP